MSAEIPALRLSNVAKSYGTAEAVRDVSFEVARGEFFALLGPSGCGKTSTLRMVAGLVRPSTGEIFINGVSVTDTPPHRRGIAMVFQSYALFPHMTVAENVAFGLEMRDLPAGEVRRATAQALDMVRLSEFAPRYPRELSGGQQQRVALARAAAVSPAVLLLDEPLGALDRRLRDDMQMELRQLQQQLGVATIMVTHDQDEALTLADRIAVMQDGQIRQIGRPIDIYERPADSFVANFIGASNLLPGKVTELHAGEVIVRTDAGTVFPVIGMARLGARVVIALRPERIEVGAGADGPGLQGVLRHAVYLGRQVSFHVELANGERLIVTEQSRQGATGMREPGSTVRLSWHPADAKLLDA